MTDHTTTSAAAGFALATGEGETLWWEFQLFTIECSAGRLGLVDCNLEAGSGPPMHIHTREDEFIYVLDGDVTAYVGEEELNAQPGDFVYIPRNVPHTFAANGAGSARVGDLHAERVRARVLGPPHRRLRTRRSRAQKRRATTSPSLAGPSRTPASSSPAHIREMCDRSPK